MVRERDALLGRMSDLTPQVQKAGEVDSLRGAARFPHGCRYHLQRLHDLAYDDVEAEFGGSE